MLAFPFGTLYEGKNFSIVNPTVTVSLYSYFAEASKRSDLPNPNGSLVSPAAIKEANEAVKSVTSEGKSKRRGSYAKFSPEQQAAIGKYASLHGNQAAIRPSSIEPRCGLLVFVWSGLPASG